MQDGAIAQDADKIAEIIYNHDSLIDLFEAMFKERNPKNKKEAKRYLRYLQDLMFLASIEHMERKR